MKINIVDVGSATQLVERKSSGKDSCGDFCGDVIGVGYRVHEPLGACYVASYALKQCHDIKIISPLSAQVSIEEILENNPDAVAFSAMTYNYPFTARIAKEIKSKIQKHSQCLAAIMPLVFLWK